MIIPIDITNIIYEYSRPLTIDCLSNERKKFYGICQNKDCKEYICFCTLCWKNFNIIYDMTTISNSLPALEVVQDKMVKYFIIRKIINKFNFRDLKDYNTHFYLFLVKLNNYCKQIQPIHISNQIDYRKLFLFSYLMSNFLI
jgi:hypothetical protein